MAIRIAVVIGSTLTANPAAGYLTAASPAGRTYAVVVGIADYRYFTFQNGDLRYADQDAERFMAFLQSDKGGRVPASQIRLLKNQQATRRRVTDALAIFDKARPGDRVICYFSGHGVQNGFVPYEAQKLSDPMLTYEAIKAKLRASPAKIKICIADACLAGNMRTTSVKQKMTPTAKAANESVAMILSSRSNQTSSENRIFQSGVFSYFLLRGLGGQADQNKNKIVTIRELYKYMAPRIQKSTLNGQAPVFFGKFPDTMPMAYL